MKLTHSLRSDRVKHLRLKTPLVVQPGTPVREAIALMQRTKEGCVLVCDPSGTVVGIFTERDVLRRVIGERVLPDSPMTEVMSTKLACVRETDTVTRALQLLHREGLRHLPVVDDQHQAVGLVSIRRVFEYLVEHFPQEVYNLPPDSSTVVESREGA